MSWNDCYEEDFGDYGGYDDNHDNELDDDDLMECPSCGKDVFDGAPRCPYCGCYITRDTSLLAGRPAWFKLVWAFIVLFLILVMLGFCF